MFACRPSAARRAGITDHGSGPGPQAQQESGRPLIVGYLAAGALQLRALTGVVAPALACTGRCWRAAGPGNAAGGAPVPEGGAMPDHG
jgi:hypothetical protein